MFKWMCYYLSYGFVKLLENLLTRGWLNLLWIFSTDIYRDEKRSTKGLYQKRSIISFVFTNITVAQKNTNSCKTNIFPWYVQTLKNEISLKTNKDEKYTMDEILYSSLLFVKLGFHEVHAFIRKFSLFFFEKKS